MTPVAPFMEYVNELSERRDDRRSPVGNFMLGALGSANGQAITHAKLMSRASEQQLSVSEVLAWISVAQEGDLVDVLTVDERPALRLTPAGQAVATTDRRSAERRDA